MTKRLIDVDDDALDAERARLGTITIKDTVNEALCNAARDRSTQLASALSVLTDANLDDRSAAWSYDARLRPHRNRDRATDPMDRRSRIDRLTNLRSSRTSET